MTAWLEQLPHWALILVFVGAWVLVFFVKKLIFGLFHRWSRKTDARWDDFLIHTIEFPFTLWLLTALLGFVPVVFEIPKRWGKVVGLSAKLIGVLALALFVQKVLLAVQRRYVSTRQGLKTYSGLTRVLISIGVYSVFLLIFLDTVGISITPLVASLGVGGVAVALALQDTLSNLFSGIYVVVDQPLRVGDYVQIESGEEGYVESIGWRSVRIRRLQNNSVIIPNSKLAGSIITNYDQPQKELAVLMQVGVDYASDLAKVEKVTIEVARDIMKTVEGGIPEFEPFIRYHTFADFSINFTVILRAKEFVNQYLIKHEFVKRLHVRYAQEGITIPFPIRTVHMETPASQ